jgi:exodeoxyribonuclease V gamma subunit
MSPIVFTSNRVTALYDKLADILFGVGGSPFTRRIVVVPSPAFHHWLNWRLADDKDVGIAMGVEFVYLTNIVTDVISRSFTHDIAGDGKRVPTSFELSFYIETYVRSLFDKNYDAVWRPLFEHLSLETDHGLVIWSPRSEKRLRKICDTLTDLFFHYSLYGRRCIEAWTTQGAPWQQLLWQHLFGEGGVYGVPFQDMLVDHTPRHGCEDIQMHIFVPGYISRMQHEFFCSLAKSVPVYYYMLSPCMMFWSDIYSDREMRWVRNLYQKKEVAEAEQRTLEEILRDRNPLLANFGRMGRELFSTFLDSDIIERDVYYLPEACRNHPRYEEVCGEEIIYEKSPEILTLLHAVQSDIHLMRSYHHEEPLDIEEYDMTLQMHAVPSKLREVQTAYDAVMRIFHDNSDSEDPILPSDIFVLAPHIEEYEHLIHMVFGGEGSVLPYHIPDAPLMGSHTLVASFLSLLALPQGRWDAPTLCALFEDKYFQARHTFSYEEIQNIRHWIHATGIRWGHDHSHRDEMLLRDACFRGFSEKTERATWEEGMRQVILGLVAATTKDEEETFATSALESMDFTAAETAGRFLFLLRSMREDCAPLIDGTTMTLKAWGEYLQDLLEAYFAIPKNDDAAEWDVIVNALTLLTKAPLVTEEYSFLSVYQRFFSMLRGARKTSGESMARSVVTCASYHYARALPARVIVLMGMNDGVFPRRNTSSVLNMITGDSTADYSPTSVDEDRYLFLETLLSAEDYCIITYQDVEDMNTDKGLPSLLVRELVHYLDTAYRVAGKPASESCVIRHPFLEFDAQYFSAKTSALQSYSIPRYNAAAAYYGKENLKAHALIPELFTSQPVAIVPPKESPQEIAIDVRHIAQALKNPFKVYCNTALGVYLEGDYDVLKRDEDFTLETLDRLLLQRESFFYDMSCEALEHKLPFGVFKEAAWQRVEEEKRCWQEHCQAFGVMPQDIMTVEMQRGCSQPYHVGERAWIAPALEMKYDDTTTVYITGTLFDVTEKGLITFGKSSLADAVKAWPHYLVFSALMKKVDMPFGDDLLFMKDGAKKEPFFDDPEPLLRAVIRYYLLCQENMSPLIPDVLDSMVGGDTVKAQNTLMNYIQGVGKWNSYATWIMDEEETVAKEAVTAWFDEGKGVFEEIAAGWFPRKKGGRR